jgi:hypothetical protein
MKTKTSIVGVSRSRYVARADLSLREAGMRPLLLIIGAAVIVVASYSADARGGGHSGGRAHFAGHRFGMHHFGFNRFNRFGFNRRFDRDFSDGGWGYGGYGGGYGDYGYPSVLPSVVVMPQPTPGAAPARERVGDLPPCHEVTPFGVVVDRGMGCSRGAG